MLKVGSGSRARMETAKRRSAPGVEVMECMGHKVDCDWYTHQIHFWRMDDTSQPIELLVSVDRDAPATLGAQIEDQLAALSAPARCTRRAQMPSTRDLARQLGISRRVVVDAYAQLAAEGYLSLRQGARPQVAAAPALDAAEPEPPLRAASPAPVRLPPQPSRRLVVPPRRLAAGAAPGAARVTDAELGYGDPRGVEALRAGLSDYLGRVRGVVSTPSGCSSPAATPGARPDLPRPCGAGARRIAFEDPSDDERRLIAAPRRPRLAVPSTARASGSTSWPAPGPTP